MSQWERVKANTKQSEKPEEEFEATNKNFVNSIKLVSEIFIHFNSTSE
jgi:hypothetical protein